MQHTQKVQKKTIELETIGTPEDVHSGIPVDGSGIEQPDALYRYPAKASLPEAPPGSQSGKTDRQNSSAFTAVSDATATVPSNPVEHAAYLTPLGTLPGDASSISSHPLLEITIAGGALKSRAPSSNSVGTVRAEASGMKIVELDMAWKPPPSLQPPVPTGAQSSPFAQAQEPAAHPPERPGTGTKASLDEIAASKQPASTAPSVLHQETPCAPPERNEAIAAAAPPTGAGSRSDASLIPPVSTIAIPVSSAAAITEYDALEYYFTSARARSNSATPIVTPAGTPRVDYLLAAAATGWNAAKTDGGGSASSAAAVPKNVAGSLAAAAAAAKEPAKETAVPPCNEAVAAIAAQIVRPLTPPSAVSSTTAASSVGHSYSRNDSVLKPSVAARPNHWKAAPAGSKAEEEAASFMIRFDEDEHFGRSTRAPALDTGSRTATSGGSALSGSAAVPSSLAAEANLASALNKPADDKATAPGKAGASSAIKEGADGDASRVSMEKARLLLAAQESQLKALRGRQNRFSHLGPEKPAGAAAAAAMPSGKSAPSQQRSARDAPAQDKQLAAAKSAGARPSTWTPAAAHPGVSRGGQVTSGTASTPLAAAGGATTATSATPPAAAGGATTAKIAALASVVESTIPGSVAAGKGAAPVPVAAGKGAAPVPAAAGKGAAPVPAAAGKGAAPVGQRTKNPVLQQAAVQPSMATAASMTVPAYPTAGAAGAKATAPPDDAPVLAAAPEGIAAHSGLASKKKKKKARVATALGADQQPALPAGKTSAAVPALFLLCDKKNGERDLAEGTEGAPLQLAPAAEPEPGRDAGTDALELLDRPPQPVAKAGSGEEAAQELQRCEMRMQIRKRVLDAQMREWAGEYAEVRVLRSRLEETAAVQASPASGLLSDIEAMVMMRRQRELAALAAASGAPAALVPVVAPLPPPSRCSAGTATPDADTSPEPSSPPVLPARASLLAAPPSTAVAPAPTVPPLPPASTPLSSAVMPGIATLPVATPALPAPAAQPAPTEQLVPPAPPVQAGVDPDSQAQTRKRPALAPSTIPLEDGGKKRSRFGEMPEEARRRKAERGAERVGAVRSRGGRRSRSYSSDEDDDRRGPRTRSRDRLRRNDRSRSRSRSRSRGRAGGRRRARRRERGKSRDRSDDERGRDRRDRQREKGARRDEDRDRDAVRRARQADEPSRRDQGMEEGAAGTRGGRLVDLSRISARPLGAPPADAPPATVEAAPVPGDAVHASVSEESARVHGMLGLSAPSQHVVAAPEVATNSGQEQQLSGPAGVAAEGRTTEPAPVSVPAAAAAAVPGGPATVPQSAAEEELRRKHAQQLVGLSAEAAAAVSWRQAGERAALRRRLNLGTPAKAGGAKEAVRAGGEVKISSAEAESKGVPAEGTSADAGKEAERRKEEAAERARAAEQAKAAKKAQEDAAAKEAQQAAEAKARQATEAAEEARRAAEAATKAREAAVEAARVRKAVQEAKARKAQEEAARVLKAVQEKAAEEKARKVAEAKAAQEKAVKEAELKAAKRKEAKDTARKALKESKEKEAREKAAREKEAREKEAREKAAREKAAQEKAAREKAARDKEAREKEAQEKLPPGKDKEPRSSASGAEGSAPPFAEDTEVPLFSSSP
eukprot:gene16667-19803_t